MEGVASPATIDSLLRVTWDVLASSGQTALEAVVEAVRESAAAVDGPARSQVVQVLHDVYERERRGSLNKYRAQLERVVRSCVRACVDGLMVVLSDQ